LKFFCIQDGVGDEGGVILMVGTMCVFELVLAVKRMPVCFPMRNLGFEMV
jgi:hypothetical protein